MKCSIIIAFTLALATRAATAAPADFPTPWVEGAQVGEVVTAQAVISPRRSEGGAKESYGLVVLTDRSQQVGIIAQADKGIVDTALVGHMATVKGKVIACTGIHTVRVEILEATAAKPTEAGGPGGGPALGGGPDLTPEEQQARMEQARVMAGRLLKAGLASSDEQWKAVEPLVLKIIAARRAFSVMAHTMVANPGDAQRAFAIFPVSGSFGSAPRPVTEQNAGGGPVRTGRREGPGAVPGPGVAAGADKAHIPGLADLSGTINMLEVTMALGQQEADMPTEIAAFKSALLDLRESASKAEVTDEQIKDKIKVVRETREAALKALTALQDELRQKLDPRQEILLMAVNVLD